jgi:exodeoxyribonuclease-3
MRIMSYNLLNAGRDGARDERWRAEVEVIRDVAPNVLLLQEARQFDAAGGEALFAAEAALGVRGLLAVAPHTGQHTAVFFKPEIRPVRFDPDAAHFHHALAQATLRIPGFDLPATVASMHLSPLHPALRDAEVGWLAGLAAPDRYSILAGNANSLAPGDAEPPDWQTLPAHFPVRYLTATASGPSAADRSALTFLHAAGFIDAASARSQARVATVPSAGFPDAEFVAFRSDHVLLSPLIAPGLVGYEVVSDDRTATASDHLPLFVEIDPSKLVR